MVGIVQVFREMQDILSIDEDDKEHKVLEHLQQQKKHGQIT